MDPKERALIIRALRLLDRELHRILVIEDRVLGDQVTAGMLADREAVNALVNRLHLDGHG